MDRTEGKRLLKHLREARGWSWTDEALAVRETARQLGLERLAAVSTASVRRSLARWESPTGTVPDERYQLVLAHLFADRAGRFELGPGSDFRLLMTTFAALELPPRRIAELEADVVQRAEPQQHNPFLPGSGPVDVDLDRLAEVEQSYWLLNSQIGRVPFPRSQVALAPFVELFRRLDLSEGIPATARSAAAHCFAVAGRLAFELHDDVGAQSYYALALVQAERLPDTWMTASVYTSLAMVTMHRADTADAAEGIARQAVQAAEAGSSLSARARALAVQAEVEARRQLTRPATTTLELAQAQLAQVPADDPGGTGFDQARLAGFLGLCWMLVGRTQEAVTELERAAAAVTAPADAVQRSIIVADLAQAYVRGEAAQPEVCASYLHECAELVGRTRGRVAMGRIRDVRRTLHPWNGTSFVGELDEHLFEAVLR